MTHVLCVVLIGLPSPSCWAQDEGRPGCSATLDGAKFPKPQAKKYTVAVRWRPAAAGIQVQAHLTRGGTEVGHDWLPAGFGWVVLELEANLHYRVTYGPDPGYTLDIMIPDAGNESCTWK